MTRLSPTLAAISAWGVTVYGALLPFHAFGNVPARRWTLLEPCELALLAVAPAVLHEIVRWRRQLLASRVVWGVALLALAGILAELLSPRASRLVILKEALAPLAVGGIACAVLRGRGRELTLSVLLGGSVALTLSAIGYALALATDLRFAQAFVFASDHPLFPGWPRMTGTLGRHAVWLGEFCVMLLAVALAANPRIGSRPLILGARVAASLGLLVSVSFAWFGGLVLAASRVMLSRPRYRGAIWLALLLVYLGVAFWMLIGARVDPVAHGLSRPCRELDGAHHVLGRSPPSGVCQPVLSLEPYPHRVTLYALGHQTSWERFVQHPLLGAGRSGYGAFARAHAARIHDLGPVGYYQEPVGLVASTLAYTGLAGAAAWAVALYGIWRARRSWIFYGVLGLVWCGTLTDLELRGPLWLLLGLLVGLSAEHDEIAAAPRAE